MSFLIPWCGVGLTLLLSKLFPTSFNVLFLINIWLFSLPHTFSTFTRSDRRRSKAIIFSFSLLAIFLLSVLTLSSISGMVVLYSFYFYWQQFHYGKQNLGLSVWNLKEKAKWVDHAFYLSIVALSLVGLLGGEAQSFFGYVLYSPFTWSFSLHWIFIAMLGLTLVYLLIRPGQKWFALEHTLIFSLAYLYTEHFALGWLLLNVFHNLQYLKFMKSFERSIRFLLIPLVMTGFLYLLQFHVFKGLILWSVPLSLGLMLALNFTHYTLDGLIWRRN